MPSAATLLAAGGLVLLILTTFLMPVAREALPLAGSTLEARDVALAGLLTAVWLAAALVRREPGVGVPVVVGMFYLGACLMAWLAPGWHSALYASTLLLLALVVLVVRRPVGELLRLSEAGIAIAMRLAAVTVMTVGLGAQAALFELRSWQTAVLLGVSAVFWITDALLAEKHRPGLLPGSALLVFAAGSLAWWVTAPHATGGEVALAAALTGTLIATSALFLRSAEGWRAPWPLGAGLASTFMCVVALEAPGPLAVSLAPTTVTWAITALTFESELAFAAAVTALLGVLATLAWADGPAWASVVALLGASAAMLAPSVLMSAGLSDRRAPAVRALACAGVGGPLLLLALRFPSAVGLPIADWARIGEQGTVVALLGLGAYGVVAGVLHRFEPAIYAGGGALVLACWAQIAALDVSGVAPYGLVLAIYIAWVGSHWASVNDVAPPLVTDVFSALVALVPSAVAAVAVSGAYNAWPDLLWAVAIALAAIGLGVALKVRSYFFGGSAALVFVALARSWIYLAQFWWLVLGIIGVAMLVIALTWERQQRLLSSARDRVEDTFEGWR